MDNNNLNQDQSTAQSGGILGKAASLFNNVDMKQIPTSLKQYGNTAASTVKNMSTTQKVVGGALLAAGAWYLAKQQKGGYKASAAHSTRTDY